MIYILLEERTDTKLLRQINCERDTKYLQRFLKQELELSYTIDGNVKW